MSEFSLKEMWLGLKVQGQSKTFPSTGPDIEVGIASRLEISSLGQKASRIKTRWREVKGLLVQKSSFAYVL